ncbi:uncharacterized protein TNCV_2870791 [Trichonephila clavipes]|nr:uncharacterized protein TNCV_2870791 [Trichonephila clavipes]
MPRLQKVLKKRKGKYYPRKNTINSKVSTTDCKLNAQAEHAHDSKHSCEKEKRKIPDLNESFSSFGDSVEFSSSNFHEGTQIATINTRFVYAMRSIGKGAEAGRMFCGDSIQNAAKEAICENEGNKNIAVAVDGTWQKRGYTSLNGVVTVTSIDTVILWISYSRNHSSVQNMRQAIWAIFLHKLSTDEYPQHGFCPIGKIHGVDLKRLKHQIETLSLGVYDAVCSFNDGNVSKLKMLQKMGVEPGEFSVSVMKLLDRERLMKAIYAFSGRS